MKFLVFLLFVLSAGCLQGAISPRERAQLEQAQAVSFHYLHLLATSLLNDLVFEWTYDPPLGGGVDLAVQDINIPLGLNAHFLEVIENHFYNLVLQHPQTGLRPFSCPECRSLTATATADGTLLQRGALSKYDERKYALNLDFEIDKSILILRAQISKMGRYQPIVYAKTLSISSRSSALKDGRRLISASEAEENHLRILRGNAYMQTPIRVRLSNFSSTLEPSPPSIWMETGYKMWLTENQRWIHGVDVSMTSDIYLYNGVNVAAYVSRLVSSDYPSLIEPNVYFSGGINTTYLVGDFAGALHRGASTKGVFGIGENAQFMSMRLGVEVQWYGLLSFVAGFEWLPGLSDQYYLISKIPIHLWTFSVGGHW